MPAAIYQLDVPIQGRGGVSSAGSTIQRVRLAVVGTHGFNVEDDQIQLKVLDVVIKTLHSGQEWQDSLGSGGGRVRHIYGVQTGIPNAQSARVQPASNYLSGLVPWPVKYSRPYPAVGGTAFQHSR